MSEEEMKRYLAKLAERTKELKEDPKKGREFLESCGICDHEGNLTSRYK